MNKEVNDWIENNIEDLKNDIKALCSIPSVNAPAVDDKPFGEEAYRALVKTLELGKAYGFETKNHGNYVGTMDFDSSLPHTLDILGHVDVVPAGEGWTVTEPFNVIEKDGRLYGRGTSDDKGPLLSAIYALRAIKETHTPLTKGVRVIVGSDEETGSYDIAHYYEKEEKAPQTFSPDSGFPLINIEKGMFRGTISKNFEEDKATPRLLSLDAGISTNAVPQKAVLKFEGLDINSSEKIIQSISEKCNVEINITGEQEITIVGESAHASTPEKGRNAGIAALMLVSALNLAPSEMISNVNNVLSLFPYGVTDGSGIGIKMSDKESHDLTSTLDIFKITPTHMEFTFDARTPVMATKENCENIAKKIIESYGLSFDTDGMVPPHVVPADSEFVRTLLSAYENVTGLKGECMAVGGGTYVHDIENGVAFGAVMPGIDTHMHGADEFIDIDNLITAAKVYAEAILRLCS